MPVEESGNLKTFSDAELDDIAQKAQQFEEVGKILKSKQSEINKIAKDVNKDQKAVLREVSGLKKQQKAEQRKIDQELKKITKANNRKGGIYASDDADIPTLPKNKDTRDFMKFRKEIDPDATWDDWINSQGRIKKAQNPKRAAGDSKIRPTIEEPGAVEAIMMALGVKKFKRKTAKDSLISAGGRPSQEGDNEFYTLRRRVEAVEGANKGFATFLTKTQTLLGGASGMGGTTSNIGNMLQSPQGMANLAQNMFGGVASTLTTLGNPENIKMASKSIGGLAKSLSSTVGIGNAAAVGAGTQSAINGVMGKITAISSKLPLIGIIVYCGDRNLNVSSERPLGSIQARRTKRCTKRTACTGSIFSWN